ncbi:hypothetical protein GCM10023093_05900 [Nemorincola caseinilytica]|uniref:BIG2 domain-containing protein n=1 Tax=Nemorincola caseinilytica TaxID=2054315 RepID=A0ABP8N6N1_9BACT
MSTLNAAPGTTITISGSNFNATATQNIVYFGATQATATAGGSTSVTVPVPAGATYGPVVLKNLATNLMAYSPSFFVPTYDNSSYANNTVNFDAAVEIPAGLRSVQPGLADFDGDSKADLVVSNANSNTLSVYRNQNSSGAITSGAFGSAISVATGNVPCGINICDVDRDGKLDVICANNSDKTFTVHRNTTSGSSIAFTSAYTSSAFTGLTRLFATGDIDRDGRPDIVMSQNTAQLVVIRNTSTPANVSFATAASITLPQPVNEVKIADLNGDNKAEVIGTMSANNSIFILGNNSNLGTITTASFQASVNIAATGVSYLEVADMDQDGRTDVILGRGSIISILRNSGATGAITTGTLETMVDFETGSAMTGITIADVNGDGRPDIIGTNSTSVFVLRNTATSGTITTASLAPYVSFSLGSSPSGAMVAAGDIDGDGKPDIVAANNNTTGSNTLSILRNKPLSPVTGTASVCMGNTTMLSTAFAGGTWSSSNEAIASIATDGTVTGLAAGMANISYCGNAGTAYAGNCVVTTVTVNERPSLTVIATPASICSGSSSTLSVTGADTYSWSPSGSLSASTGSTVTANPTTTTTYDVIGTNTAGCSATISKTLSVAAIYNIVASAGAHGSISPAGTTTVCSGNDQVYTITASEGYLIDDVLVDGASVGAVGSYTFLAVTAAHTINATFRLDCTAPEITSAATVSNILCHGSNTGSIVPHVSGSAPLVWQWSNSATTASLTGVPAGAYTYTVSNGCGTVTATATIAQPETALSTSTTITNVNCYGNSTGSVSVSAAGGTAPYTGTGSYTDLSAGSFSYTVTDANGCTSVASGTIAQPAAALTASATATNIHCNGENNGAVLVSASGGTTPYSGTGDITGLSAGSYSYTVTDANGCTSTTSANVTEPAAVVADAATSSPVICDGNTITLTATGAATYTWAGGYLSATSGASVSATPTSGSFPATFVYTVTGYDTAGCGSAPDTVSVTVLSIGTTSGPGSLCSGSTITLSNTSPGGTWSSASSAVSVDSISGQVTGVTAGTAIVTYTLAAGCTRNTTVTVSASPNPVMGIPTICQGSGLSLSNGTPGGTWSSSNANISVSISGSVATIYGVSNGTANVSYILPSGCYTYKTFTVAPLAAITGPTEVCAGSTIQLVHPQSGALWSSNNTSRATVNLTSGMVTGISAGTAVFTYMVNPSCYATHAVTVNTSPANIAGPTVVCEGATMTLLNTTTGGTWSNDNVTAASIDATTGLVTGLAAGVANISYTLPNGCFKSSAVTVNVAPAVISGSSDICATRTATFANATMGGSWSCSPTTVLNINATTGVATGNLGNATVTYSLPTGCRSIKQVTVNALPGAITGTTGICAGNTTGLSSTTPSLTWSSSDEGIATVSTATTTSGTVNGIAAGNATISYTSAVGCTQTVNVTVYAVPGTITGNSNICVGATTPYTNSVGGGTWASPSVAVATVGSASGIVTGIGAGNFILTYTTPGGCRTTRTLSVDALPNAITGTLSTCVGGNTTLATTSTGGIWSSTTSAATVSTTGVVTGQSTGTTLISYTNAAGCARTASVNVTTGLPTIAGPSFICTGGSTTLTNTTAGGTWASSNAAASINASTALVAGVSEGAATITYRTSTTCFTTKSITVQSAPAAITTSSASVCVGSSQQLTHETTGGTWTSSLASRATVNATGLVTGVANGAVTISYTPSAGCLVTTNLTVNLQPVALTGTFSVCRDNTTTLSSTTTGGAWSSSDPAIATVVTASSTTGIVTGGTTTGIATISYTNALGCSRTAAVTVSAAVPAISGMDIVCIGNSTALSNATPGGTWSSATPAKGSISTVGVVTGVAAGTTTISYRTNSTCFTTRTMTVNGAVAAITGTTSVCKDNSTTLACTTPGGTWVSSNTANATVVEATGAVTGMAAGTAIITYQVTGTGCFKLATVSVLASPAPIDGTLTIATGTSTTLSNTVSGGTWSSSATTIAGIGSATGIMTGVSVGNATITYRLTNGCQKTVLASITTPMARPLDGATTPETRIAQVRIFPNPSVGNITIETAANGVFTVYTMDGKQAARYDVAAPAASVSLPYDLAAGMYTCHFMAEDGTATVVRLVYKP